MAKISKYEQGKIDGRDELVELINAAPQVVKSIPSELSDKDIAALEIDVADNFQDMTDDERVVILEYVITKINNYLQ